MRGPITQEAAQQFIPAFYTALQNGLNVEAAVAAGRSALAIGLSGTLDWCLPILYTNEGISDKAPLPQAADQLGGLLGHPAATLLLARAIACFGVAHLIVGTLTGLSGRQPPLPDERVLAGISIVLFIASLAIAAWAYGGHAYKSVAAPRALPSVSVPRLALFLRIWASAAIGTGLAMTFVGLAAVSAGGSGCMVCMVATRTMACLGAECARRSVAGLPANARTWIGFPQQRAGHSGDDGLARVVDAACGILDALPSPLGRVVGRRLDHSAFGKLLDWALLPCVRVFLVAGRKIQAGNAAFVCLKTTSTQFLIDVYQKRRQEVFIQ